MSSSQILTEAKTAPQADPDAASPIRAIRSGNGPIVRIGRWLERPQAYVTLYPVLSLLNAAVGLLLPMLLGPVEFGRYSLVTTLFQYGLIFDFGVSHLIDQRVSPHAGDDGHRASETADRLMFVRICVALVAALAGLPILAAVSLGSEDPVLPFGLSVLAMTAGLCNMIGLGPAAVARARSNYRMFTIANLSLSLGLTLPRPIGVLLGGVGGCFGAMAGWYAVVGIALQWRFRPNPRHMPDIGEVIETLRHGLPLFLTSLSWAFYMTANRWAASRGLDAHSFGQFAFGANILYLLAGTAAALAQIYYPKIILAVSQNGHDSCSSRLAGDYSKLAVLSGLVTGVGLCATPTAVAILFQDYREAIPVLGVLLCSLPACVVGGWLMPLLLTLGHRPWRVALCVYLPPTLLLIALIRAAGTDLVLAGWAGSASTLLLVGLQLTALRLEGILRTRSAAGIMAAVSAATGLAALTLAIVPGFSFR